MRDARRLAVEEKCATALSLARRRRRRIPASASASRKQHRDAPSRGIKDGGARSRWTPKDRATPSRHPWGPIERWIACCASARRREGEGEPSGRSVSSSFENAVESRRRLLRSQLNHHLPGTRARRPPSRRRAGRAGGRRGKSRPRTVPPLVLGLALLLLLLLLLLRAGPMRTPGAGPAVRAGAGAGARTPRPRPRPPASPSRAPVGARRDRRSEEEGERWFGSRARSRCL